MAITGALIAWGYLVYLAIDFGTSARSGQSAAWGLLALSALGAVACLFTGLLLASRLLRTLGILSSATDEPADPTIETQPTRVPGGRRALR